MKMLETTHLEELESCKSLKCQSYVIWSFDIYKLRTLVNWVCLQCKTKC
jgi:hypothetical protein